MKKYFLNVALTVALILTIALFYQTFKILEKKVLYPLEYGELIVEYSKEYNLSPYLVASTINVESGFDKSAVSSKGAKGLMQIIDGTAEYISNRLGEGEYEIFNERTNIKYGCYYIRYLLDRFHDEKLALCAYNAGEGVVREWLKIKKYSSDGKSLDIVPYKETEKYVEKIYKNKVKYEKIYNNILDKP